MGNDILRELRKAGLISDVKMSEELQSRDGENEKVNPPWSPKKDQQHSSEGARSDQA